MLFRSESVQELANRQFLDNYKELDEDLDIYMKLKARSIQLLILKSKKRGFRLAIPWTISYFKTILLARTNLKGDLILCELLNE